MKLTNLIDNANKQNLSIMSSAWNWFNGLLIGSLAATGVIMFCAFWKMSDDGLNVTYGVKKKK